MLGQVLDNEGLISTAIFFRRLQEGLSAGVYYRFSTNAVWCSYDVERLAILSHPDGKRLSNL
jgi:hypothetical protein